MITTIKKYSPKFVKGGIIASMISCGYIFYKEEDLRGSPIQIIKGSIRPYRLFIAGIKMAWVYKNFLSNLTLQERHKKAAEILRLSFEKNAGTYIKLG